MKIDELSVEQIDRSIDSIRELICDPSFHGNADAQVALLMKSNSFKENVAAAVIQAQVIAAVFGLDRAFLSGIITGVYMGFALRDIAAVDEALESVERAS